MKLVLFALIVLICSLSCSGQKLSEIKRQNTFFILFEEGDYSKRNKLIPEEEEIYSYEFFYDDKKSGKKKPYSFLLFYNEYWNNKDANNKINKRIIYRLHKSFLKKNKEIIITKKFLDNLGENKIIDLLEDSNRHIFIIDKRESSRNKILIREVRLYLNAYE